ncbi:DnrO protein [Aerolutibacter ruishenii]|uniref:DnrO protein n=1 Tax=Aerolutibacter ruishenii TaxID=686800 RepID=A0A562LXY2_9GAMM|nr:DnrO protein [Lysobacter ruishenii]TWI12509.1 hypothetical protein IP93_00850 [Lysobacter ruishenii]
MLSRIPFDTLAAALTVGIAAALCASPAKAQSHEHAAHAAHSQAAAAQPPADAHAHHGQDKAAAHDHHGQESAAAPVPPVGQRWATDAPLQDGMGRIRQAVTMLEHMEMGHVDPKQVPAFADQIQSAVNDMIANCKLEPDADAALHGLLVKFIAGADAVRTGPVTLDTLKPMQDALAQYPTQFDDPTWDAASVD